MKKKSWKVPFMYYPSDILAFKKKIDIGFVWFMEEYPYFNENDTTCRTWVGKGHYEDFKVEWRDNYKFKTALKIVNWNKGRSAVRVYLQGDDDTIYTATLKSFVDALRKGASIENEVISEMEWTFAKKGANYTIIPV